jgi:predicted RNA-binding Zn-ribbon protein involved in translation (DUF1610 family)
MLSSATAPACHLKPGGGGERWSGGEGREGAMKCKSCEREIPDDAVLCPYCGKEVGRGQSAKKRSCTSRVVLIFLAVIVIGSLIVMSRGDNGGGGGGGPTDFDAYVACQLFVKSELVAASTAEFPPTQDASISQEGNNFIVSGTVDAENAQGVPMRYDWVCEVTYEDEDWTLNSLVFLE